MTQMEQQHSSPRPHVQPLKLVGFNKIQLLKKQTLGVGSYGFVCKVMCDDLLCAAKIIHPTLVESNPQISQQREHRLPINRFETECAVLEGIRHPNIIQYLGLYQDPETGLPVLLMELMDESLTHFLERSIDHIPYHIQLDISLDISKALSYLHSNGIVHRDLSSNNILLIGKGVRAKLTDFGMAKLINVKMSRVSNTSYPGTDVYMPPEAVDNQVVYTEKGDVFSVGVNIVQILSRKFPQPGDRFKTVFIEHPQFPSGQVDVRVSEIERRNNHIVEIIPTHPLLSIAIDCLNDQECKRPSASDLCQKIYALKKTQECIDSQRRAAEKNSTDSEKDVLIAELQEQLRVQQLHNEETSGRVVTDIEADVEPLTQSLDAVTTSVEEGAINDKGHLNEHLKEDHPNLQSQEAQSARLESDHQCSEAIPSQEEKDDTEQANPQPQVLLSSKYGKNAPCTMYRYTDAVVKDKVAYFKRPRSRTILAFDSTSDLWSQLPDCMADHTTLAIVESILTTVGGKKTNHLFSFIEGRWIEVFPPMPTERQNVIAISANNALIVAGGEECGLLLNTTLKTVEVMNTTMRQWATATNLPHPLFIASAAVCSDHIYMLGGWRTVMEIPNTILTSSVPTLLQSCQPKLFEGQSKNPQSSPTPVQNVWTELSHPCTRSTCTVLHNQIITVGGWSVTDSAPSNAILMYDQTEDSWHTIGYLKLERMECFAVVLPSDKLMVVGGVYNWKNNETDTVEFAT